MYIVPLQSSFLSSSQDASDKKREKIKNKQMRRARTGLFAQKAKTKDSEIRIIGKAGDKTGFKKHEEQPEKDS